MREIGCTQLFRHEQVGLRIADEVFDEALGLGIRGLAEVRPKAVVGGEAHVVRHRDDEVRDHRALEAPHAVREYDLRHPAEDLEALREERQRRLPPLVVREAHEAEAAPGRDRAEHVQAGLDTPVDREHFARCPDPRTTSAVVSLSKAVLLLCDEAAEVARRAGVTRRERLGEQALRGDATVRAGDAGPDNLRDILIVVAARLWLCVALLVRLDDALHRLVGCSGHCGRRSEGKLPSSRYAAITSMRSLAVFNRGVLRSGRVLVGTATVSDRGTPVVDQRGVGTFIRPPVGTFSWPPVGTSNWPPVGTFSWPRTLLPPSVRSFRHENSSPEDSLSRSSPYPRNIAAESRRAGEGSERAAGARQCRVHDDRLSARASGNAGGRGAGVLASARG